MNFATSGSSPAEVDVAVIGRGAIGCAAALGLSQAGLRVALIGPVPEAESADWDPRIFAISPASREVLERIRVWQALDRSRVEPVHEMRVFADARASAPQIHFDALEAGVDCLAQILENRNLMRALDQGLGFSSVLRISQPIVGARTDGPRASVTLADGSVVRAALMVGADGADSPVRRFLGLGAQHRDYPQRAVVANFQTSQPHQGCAWQWFGAHGVLALLPLPGKACSIVWSAPLPLADSLMALSPAALAERVGQQALGTLGDLQPMGEARCFPLRLITAERMVDSRLVLIGDAAHVVHPLAGQGLNLGFGDVAELLRVIKAREPVRDLGDRLLLRRVERARREPVMAMRLATDGLQRLFDPDAEPGLPALWRTMIGLRDIGWRVGAPHRGFASD